MSREHRPGRALVFLTPGHVCPRGAGSSHTWCPRLPEAHFTAPRSQDPAQPGHTHVSPCISTQAAPAPHTRWAERGCPPPPLAPPPRLPALSQWPLAKIQQSLQSPFRSWSPVPQQHPVPVGTPLTRCRAVAVSPWREDRRLAPPAFSRWRPVPPRPVAVPSVPFGLRVAATRRTRAAANCGQNGGRAAWAGTACRGGCWRVDRWGEGGSHANVDEQIKAPSADASRRSTWVPSPRSRCHLAVLPGWVSRTRPALLPAAHTPEETVRQVAAPPPSLGAPVGLEGTHAGLAGPGSAPRLGGHLWVLRELGPCPGPVESGGLESLPVDPNAGTSQDPHPAPLPEPGVRGQDSCPSRQPHRTDLTWRSPRAWHHSPGRSRRAGGQDSPGRGRRGEGVEGAGAPAPVKVEQRGGPRGSGLSCPHPQLRKAAQGSPTAACAEN